MTLNTEWVPSYCPDTDYCCSLFMDKVVFFSEYRTKGIKLLFSEIILSRSLNLSCVLITAEEVPWDKNFIGIDLE